MILVIVMFALHAKIRPPEKPDDGDGDGETAANIPARCKHHYHTLPQQ